MNTLLEDELLKVIVILEGLYEENIDIADEPKIEHIRKAIKHLKLSNQSH